MSNSFNDTRLLVEADNFAREHLVYTLAVLSVVGFVMLTMFVTSCVSQVVHYRQNRKGKRYRTQAIHRLIGLQQSSNVNQQLDHSTDLARQIFLKKVEAVYNEEIRNLNEKSNDDSLNPKSDTSIFEHGAM
ncbi:hypothetical protein GJ496_003423 [Pomphorhynchus laevis]|nr:hypothetical protein GJ496_003423 [Pomphorhynchus laevis]